MTDAEKKAETAKAMAAAVYHQLDQAQRAEACVRTISAKWASHSAFREYMREMLLSARLDEFLARPDMTRA